MCFSDVLTHICSTICVPALKSRFKYNTEKGIQMSERIRFSGNYNDLSSDKGFQFEFDCSRCGTTYRTRFKASVTGTVSQVLDAAGSLFGGVFHRTSDLGNRIHSSAWEKAHDDAFQEAIQELSSDFIQCPRCQGWVCKEKCWNQRKGLCKSCAPDLGVEMSAAQSSRSVEEIWAHACMADEDRKLSRDNWKDVITASCPECGVSLEKNAKFCPECGAKLAKERFCPECGAKQNSKSKFCTDCGTVL